MSEDDNWCPDEDEWTPPTEAELKVIAARRERSDKISKLMGDYLLKGYRMLASNCPHCTTVELQDKRGVKYCVACQEVDCHENSKDNPALSEEAASRSIAEEAFSSNNQPANNSNSTSHIRVESAEVERLLGGATGGSGIVTRGEDNVGTSNLDLIPRPQAESGAVARPTRRQVNSVSPAFLPSVNQGTEVDQSSYRHAFSNSLSNVLDKLTWASSQLATTQCPEKATQLVVLVRECAQTAHTLNTQMGM